MRRDNLEENNAFRNKGKGVNYIYCINKYYSKLLILIINSKMTEFLSIVASNYHKSPVRSVSFDEDTSYSDM